MPHNNKKKKQQSGAKTTLWYVKYAQEGEIHVSAKPLNGSSVHRIRTITANAAGRKYRKEILPSIDWNIINDDRLDVDDIEAKKQIKERKRKVKSFKIKVIK